MPVWHPLLSQSETSGDQESLLPPEGPRKATRGRFAPYGLPFFVLSVLSSLVCGCVVALLLTRLPHSSLASVAPTAVTSVAVVSPDLPYSFAAWSGDAGQLCVEVRATESRPLCDFFLARVSGPALASAYLRLCAEQSSSSHCFALATGGAYVVRVQAEFLQVADSVFDPHFPGHLNSSQWPRWEAQQSSAPLLLTALQVADGSSQAGHCADVGQDGAWHYRPDLLTSPDAAFPGDAWVYTPAGCEPRVTSAAEVLRCLTAGGGTLTVAGDSQAREVYGELMALLAEADDRPQQWTATKWQDHSFTLSDTQSVHFHWTPLTLAVDAIAQTKPRFAILSSGLWWVRRSELLAYEEMLNGAIADMALQRDIQWYWLTMPFSNGIESLRAHPRVAQWNERAVQLMRAAKVPVLDYWAVTMARAEEGDRNTHYGLWSEDGRSKGVCPKAIVNMWAIHGCTQQSREASWPVVEPCPALRNC